jgi:hypothetical protein
MGGFIGGIIGLGVGLWVSVSFIFPSNVLDLKLADMTIGDVGRILGGMVVTLLGLGFGAGMGSND